MKLTCKMAFFVGLFLCLVGLQRQLSAQPPGDLKPKQLRHLEADITASGQLEQTEDGRYRAQFDFGKLPAGMNGIIDLTVMNPFNETIKFSGVSKKCKCSNFRPDRYEFTPQEDLHIRVRLKLPIRRNSSKSQTSMMIENKGTPVAELVFDYELEGLLSFTELIGIVGFDSDNQTKTIEMPFIATAPTDLDKLKLNPSDSLKDCQFEIIKKVDGGCVRVTVQDSILTKSKIRGEVMISEPDTNRRDTFFLTIKNEKLAEISPTVVTFKKEGENWVATATLKMAKSVPDDEALQKIQLQCKWNGNEIAAKPKRLSDKLLQLILTTGSDLSSVQGNSSKNAVLNWTVIHHGVTSNLETPFVISE